MRKRYIPRLIFLSFAFFLFSFAWAQEGAKQATIKVQGEVTHPLDLSLADQVDGSPLPANKGPFRIVVPGEKKPARWIWQVNALVVRFAKE
ncbi:MAG TPA: hypothetical protein VL832_18000 [Puia sp.]|jgi:hypothetical protein|nr:hypothetical protein [Puia sp.]